MRDVFPDSHLSSEVVITKMLYFRSRATDARVRVLSGRPTDRNVDHIVRKAPQRLDRSSDMSSFIERDRAAVVGHHLPCTGFYCYFERIQMVYQVLVWVVRARSDSMHVVFPLLPAPRRGICLATVEICPAQLTCYQLGITSPTED